METIERETEKQKGGEMADLVTLALASMGHCSWHLYKDA